MTQASMSTWLARCLIPFGVFVLLAQGCGDSPTGGNVTFAPASGTVTMNGSPLSGARVVAYPAKGPVGMAVTDAEGKFSLSSGAEKGVALGTAKVAVSIPAESAGAAGGQTPDPMDPTSMTRSMEGMTQQRQEQGPRGNWTPANSQAKSVIPAKYANPETSGLVFEIKSGQENVLNIDIK